MNIFDIYLNKIKNIVTNNSANLKIPQNLSGINVDTAPSKFKADISTNVCMVLSSLNKLPPTEIYKQLNLDDLKNDKDIENIEFVKPGFVNIKFVKKFWNTFLTKMLNDQKYGASLKNDKKNYLLEFVSANPTGPLHVGHCRGAIYGDALCNLLKFCDHKLPKNIMLTITVIRSKTFLYLYTLELKKNYLTKNTLRMKIYIQEIT